MPRILMKQELNNLTIGHLMDYGTMYGYSRSIKEKGDDREASIKS